jgi:hypothetical protein
MPSRTGRRAIAGWLFPAVLLGLAADAGAQADAGQAAAQHEQEIAPRPPFVLRLFGNVDWQSSRDELPNTFSVGQLDVFFTSELAPDLSVLTEIVLEVPHGGQEQIAEVERFQLRYSAADALNVSVGRMHTNLGFWNQTYHHGAWLPTPVFRPEVYRFEDVSGGFLPMHEVGVRLSGGASVPALRLDYSASLTNGRDVEPETVATVQDANGSKAIGLWLGVRPNAWPWLQLGGAAVFDTIPARPDDPDRANELGERILGGFLLLQRSGLELAAEAFEIRHEDSSLGLVWTSSGLYAQAAWTRGPLKPYYRFDWIDRNEQDPYFGPQTQDVAKHTVGLRVDPWRRLALKAEASHSDTLETRFFAAAAQLAFTF